MSAALDDFIEQIVREVIRRLRAEDATSTASAVASVTSSRVTLTDKLITAASILALPAGTREVGVAKRAIVTPLAKDEARDRSIQIVRIAQEPRP